MTAMYAVNSPSPSTFQTHDPHRQQQTPSPAKRRRTGATRSDRDWERVLDGVDDPMGEPSSSNVTLDSSFISTEVASNAMRRFIARRVKEEGFEHAETPALARLECEVAACA